MFQSSNGLGGHFHRLLVKGLVGLALPVCLAAALACVDARPLFGQESEGSVGVGPAPNSSAIGSENQAEIDKARSEADARRLAGEVPFEKNHIIVEGIRNYPASFSEEKFNPGGLNYLFGFRHLSQNRWMMSVGVGFKTLFREDTQILPILTFNHEAGYVIRLQHPTYLLLGPKLLYLLPTSDTAIPLQRDPDFSAEIGVGVSGTFIHFISRRAALQLRFERWRGTGSMLFHGIELAFGASIAVGGGG